MWLRLLLIATSIRITKQEFIGEETALVVEYWQTAKEVQTERLKAMPSLPLLLAQAPMPVRTRDSTEPFVVRVDPQRNYQEIIGFGGAFTQASAEVWQSLSPSLQAEVIGAYFDGDVGLGYSTGRVCTCCLRLCESGSSHLVDSLCCFVVRVWCRCLSTHVISHQKLTHSMKQI